MNNNKIDNKIYSKIYFEVTENLNKNLGIDLSNFEFNNIKNSETLDNIMKRDIDKFENKEEMFMKISNFSNLPKKFIEKYKHVLNWNLLLINNSFTEKEILKYNKERKITWKPISKTQKLSNDFLLKHKNKVNWKYVISNNENISLEILEMQKYLNIEEILKYQKNLTEDFLLNTVNNPISFKSQKSKIIDIICENAKNYNIDCDFFEKILKKEEIIKINFNKFKCNEEFIERNNRYITMKQFNDILSYSNLSEDFLSSDIMMEYDLMKTKAVYILQYQDISEKFIDKYFNDISINEFYYILYNKKSKISEEFIKKHIDKFKSIEEIIRLRKISKEFFNELLNKNKIDRYPYFGENMTDENYIKHEKKIISLSRKDAGIPTIYGEYFSENFIEKKLHSINFKNLSENENISKEFIKKYPEYVDISVSNIDKITDISTLKKMKNCSDFKNIGNNKITYENNLLILKFIDSVVEKKYNKKLKLNILKKHIKREEDSEIYF